MRYSHLKNGYYDHTQDLWMNRKRYLIIDYREPGGESSGRLSELMLITQASLCLHNFLRITSSATYTPNGSVDSEQANGDIVEGDWRKEVRTESALVDMAKAKGGRVNSTRRTYKICLRTILIPRVLLIGK